MEYNKKNEVKQLIADEIVNLQPKNDATLNTNSKTIVGAINEVFQDVDNGKTLVAAAITDMGQTTSNTATFDVLSQNIKKIASDTTAATTDILPGKTAYLKGKKATGNMANLTTNSKIFTTASSQEKVLVANAIKTGINSDGVNRVAFKYGGSNGYLETGTYLALAASSLGINPASIMHGNTILGIAGTGTDYKPMVDKGWNLSDDINITITMPTYANGSNTDRSVTYMSIGDTTSKTISLANSATNNIINFTAKGIIVISPATRITSGQVGKVSNFVGCDYIRIHQGKIYYNTTGIIFGAGASGGYDGTIIILPKSRNVSFTIDTEYV